MKASDHPSLQGRRRARRLAAAQHLADILTSVGVEGEMTVRSVTGSRSLHEVSIDVLTRGGAYMVTAHIRKDGTTLDWPSSWCIVDFGLSPQYRGNASADGPPSAHSLVEIAIPQVAHEVWRKLAPAGVTLSSAFAAGIDGYGHRLDLAVLTQSPSGLVRVDIDHRSGDITSIAQVIDGRSMTGGAFGDYLRAQYEAEVGDMDVFRRFQGAVLDRACDLIGIES